MEKRTLDWAAAQFHATVQEAGAGGEPTPMGKRSVQVCSQFIDEANFWPHVGRGILVVR